MSQKIKFGTDGWRGVIAEDYTYKNVSITAQAISSYLKGLKNRQGRIIKKKVVVLGYDTRFMSRAFAETVACVLAANKIRVLLSNDYLPTPALSLAARDRSTCGGIMITASHNPAIFNGIKIKTTDGASADARITSRVEALLNKHSIKIIDYQDAKKKGLIKETDFITDYIKHIKKFIDMKLIKSSKMHLAVDVMCGSADKILERILQKSPIKLRYINSQPRCDFGGIKPEPIEENLSGLKKTLSRDKFSAGLATDGDADRLGAMTERGRFINSSEAFALIMKYLIDKGKRNFKIGKTVSCSELISRIAMDNSLQVTQTAIGFKYLADLIIDKKIDYACEESGGIGIGKYLPERDGILSQLLLIEMMSFYKKSLGRIMMEIDKKYGRFYYKRLDLNYNKNKKKKIMQAVSPKNIKKIIGLDVKIVISTDGIKYILKDGSWLLFRFSGTEPILRIYAESNSDKKTARMINFAKKKASK
jgi:alpha-D-glucose phosphate-specific phosphoglucomutase